MVQYTFWSVVWVEHCTDLYAICIMNSHCVICASILSAQQNHPLIGKDQLAMLWLHVKAYRFPQQESGAYLMGQPFLTSILLI